MLAYSGKSAGVKESVRGIDVSGCKPAASFFDLEISLLVASAFLAFASDLGLIVRSSRRPSQQGTGWTTMLPE
jgi:hypothetical protein